MLIRSVDGTLIEIRVEQYVNDKAYYMELLKIKGHKITPKVPNILDKILESVKGS